MTRQHVSATLNWILRYAQDDSVVTMEDGWPTMGIDPVPWVISGTSHSRGVRVFLTTEFTDRTDQGTKRIHAARELSAAQLTGRVAGWS